MPIKIIITSPSTWPRVMAQRAQQDSVSPQACRPSLRAQSRRAVGTTSSAASSRRRELSVLPPTRRLPPPSSSSQGRRDRVREERLGCFTSDADVLAQIAPARGLESWRRGLIVSPQAWRPSLPSSVSQIGRDHVLGNIVLASRAERLASDAAPLPTELKLAREEGPRPGRAPWRFHI